MMTDGSRCVVAGVDAHTRAAGCSARPPSRATRDGYEQLIAWIAEHGRIDRIGVESTGSFAAGLVRALAERAIVTVEVNQPYAHTRHRRGKSDPIDAELAARAILSAVASAIPKQTGGNVEAIRQLAVTRDSAVKARSAAFNQLENLIITAPDELRAELKRRKTLRGKATLCLKLRPDMRRLREPAQAAKLALRSLARRVRHLDLEISQLECQLDHLSRTAAPRTTRLLGVGTVHTSRLLITAGQNIDRLKSEAAFARICAAAPIPASSGRTIRHRLDRGGDRQANKTLHMIAVCRLRHCPRTQAYAARRSAEGLTKREIIRCLKRYIARELYHTLRSDLTSLAAPTPPRQAITITCGSGPTGTSRRRR
jgi:transposase